jgi:arylsulfatase
MASQPGDSAKLPNIVLILSDDAGFSDLSCYGGEIPTPNIDRLARGGLRFARFYTNARCSPTRASLLTGQYPHAVGVGDLCRPQDETPYPGYLGYLNSQCRTLADVLRSAGYHTLMSGKWHLGGERLEARRPAAGEAAKWPMARGFDRFFGLIHGWADYFLPRHPREFRLGNGVFPVQANDGFYATHAITDHAIRWIRGVRQADARPFFLYVAYTAPHAPCMAPPGAVARHRARYAGDWHALQQARYENLLREGMADRRWNWRAQGPRQPAPAAMEEAATVAAMIELMDQGVGRLIETLEDIKELDRTIIFYLSDNGATGHHAALGNVPFAGRKESLQEGGLRTHCIVHWPEGVPARGTVTHDVGHVMDILPTCAELSRAKSTPVAHPGEMPPTVDGVSLTPIFRGEQRDGNRTLFWDLYGQQAVLEGKWKYYSDRQGRARLYDLESDATETRDVAARHADRVAELRAAHAAWAKRYHVLPYETVKAAQAKHRASANSKSG